MVLLGIGITVILLGLLIQVNILHYQLKKHNQVLAALASSLLESNQVIETLIVAHNSLVQEMNEVDEMNNIDNILPLDLSNSMGLA